MKNNKFLFLLVFVVIALGALSLFLYVSNQKQEEKPVVVEKPLIEEKKKNLILMIGDGMGANHIEAANLYLSKFNKRLSFDSAQDAMMMITSSADSEITDSAAASTAMASGQKVNNGVISVATPGSGKDLKTILELSKEKCKATGIVTTTPVVDATPAAFAAHTSSRKNYQEVAKDYFLETKPNLILGGSRKEINQQTAFEAGYSIIKDRSSFLFPDLYTDRPVLGLFSNGNVPYEYDYGMGSINHFDGNPHLSEMVRFSLDVLEEDQDGLFLLIEGATIDKAAHNNDIKNTIHEVLEFDQALQAVLEWMEGRDDTLLLVTADHETGGLALAEGKDKFSYPNVSWIGKGHTSQNVPLHIWGDELSEYPEIIDNTDIFKIFSAELDQENSYCTN